MLHVCNLLSRCKVNNQNCVALRVTCTTGQWLLSYFSFQWKVVAGQVKHVLDRYMQLPQINDWMCVCIKMNVLPKFLHLGLCHYIFF